MVLIVVSLVPNDVPGIDHLLTITSLDAGWPKQLYFFLFTPFILYIVSLVHYNGRSPSKTDDLKKIILKGSSSGLRVSIISVLFIYLLLLVGSLLFVETWGRPVKGVLLLLTVFFMYTIPLIVPTGVVTGAIVEYKFLNTCHNPGQTGAE
jgi:hypothetical protein